jgi:8-amino-7-oxononanoate synthase
MDSESQTRELDDLLNRRLHASLTHGALRSLQVASPGLIDFTSNDYLGLARSEKLFQLIQDRLIERPGPINGSTGSRLLSGNSELAEQTETELTSVFNGEAALLFNSGYTANLAVLATIPQRNDTILYDELAHACMKDGARLSHARHWSFKHNDLSDLEIKLNKATGSVFVAVESVYSMDGDLAPLQQLVELTGRYGATLMVDEAHSTGAFGPGGAGLGVALGLENKIGIRIYTFGKAMGVHGACVIGSRALREYLINYARPFIYTTALPMHSILSISSAFRFLRDNLGLQDTLKERIALFKQRLTGTIEKVDSESAIQCIIIPGNERVKSAAAYLKNHGFDIRPILSPTVPVGRERIRICLHAFNSMQEVKQLAEVLNSMRIEQII